MFSLFGGCMQYVFKKNEYHVVILGIDSAGKTALLEQIKTIYNHTTPLPPEKIMPTVGLNIGRVEADSLKLVFWDLGGQEGLRALWDKYFEESHALIFVVDSADEKRFEEAAKTLESVLNNAEMPETVPLLLVANKQDLPNAVKPKELETYFMRHIDHRQVYTQGISAHTGAGIQAGIDWLCELLKKHARHLDH